MHNRFWWIKAIRGVLTLAFGIVSLLLHAVLYLLIALLGIYLILDSCMDVFHIVRGKQTPRRHCSLYLGAATSASIGLGSLVYPQMVPSLHLSAGGRVV